MLERLTLCALRLMLYVLTDIWQEHGQRLAYREQCARMVYGTMGPRLCRENGLCYKDIGEVLCR